MLSVSKENFIRTLRGDTLLASNWCKFGWHLWEKYQHFKEDSLSVYQKRYCSSCNRLQIREVRKP